MKAKIFRNKEFLPCLASIMSLIYLLLPLKSNASFIESSMGAAVVNDATASYFNPAALTLTQDKQIIALGTVAQLNDQFTGTVTQSSTGFTQSGTANSQTRYFLPSGYFAMPVSENIVFGTAVLANAFSRDVDQDSILRYAMSNNNIQDIDVIPAIGFKVNEYLSLGAAVTFSHADFLLEPSSGFPSLDIPDTQSRNEASSNAWGGDVGVLLKPWKSTLIGFNYRSAIRYQFSGTSELEGNSNVMSDNFSFNFMTPARYVLSINQFLLQSFGVIGTLQWVQSDSFDTININNIATQIGPNPVILSDVIVPLYFNNSWIYTVGGYYKFSPKWVFRTAASYFQSPGNPNYQISNGDSIIVGASIAYKLNKTFSVDCGYAHVFIQDQTIDIVNSANIINGINSGYRDSFSLKLIVNL